MLVIKILSGLSFVGSVAWFIAEPGFEPAIAIVTSLTALVLALIKGNRKERKFSQSQNVSENGIGIQAFGNVTTGDIQSKKGRPDVE